MYVPREGLGIVPVIAAAIISAVAGGGTAAYQGWQAGKSRRAAAEYQRREAELQQRKFAEYRKYLLAGGIAFGFLIFALRK